MSNPSRHGRRLAAYLAAALLSAATLGVVVTAAPSPASAQGGQVIGQLEDALKRATNKYDTLQLQAAERELEEGIAQAHRFGVTDPVLARLHVMLGVVRFALTQTEQDAYDQFVSALEVDPGVDVHPDYKTPTLDAIMERARAAVPSDPIVDNGGGGEPEVIGRPEITHRPVETATFGKPVEFVAEVPSTVPLYRITLSYRKYGQREFTTMEMKPDTETRFVATLPSGEVKTRQIDYFIEVLDRTGNILVSSGAPTSPLNIIVFGTDGADLPPDDPAGGDDARQFVFLQVTAGSGAGFATGTPNYHPDLEINPGLAPAPFHLVGELGVIINPSVHLSGFYRFQLVEREDLFGGKLKWWFDNEGPLTLYTGVGGGYGEVRHTVNLAPVVDFVDTTAEGPYHGGVGFGLAYNLNQNFAFVADFYTLLLFPTISAHLDGSVGVRTSF